MSKHWEQLQKYVAIKIEMRSTAHAGWCPAMNMSKELTCDCGQDQILIGLNDRIQELLKCVGAL